MFNAVWNDLDKHQLVALLSCLIPTSEGKDDDVAIPVELAGALSRLQELAGHIADVSNVRSRLVPSPSHAFAHAAAGAFGRLAAEQGV